MVITDEIRSACAWVSARAGNVRVTDAAIVPYAEALAASSALAPLAVVTPLASDAAREATAAFWLTLDAINFGSGWFPTLRKRNQPTGYRTIAAGVRRRFDGQGPWTAEELAQIQPLELAGVLDQDPDHELLSLFARSLRDLGDRLLADHQASFMVLVDQAQGSAVSLVQRLATWRCFADRSVYEGREIPFLKRAQIAAADLGRAGVTRFRDSQQLTLFADNLVPHVLRLDGLLEFQPALVSRIETGELIDHGSAEEVEIRACAVHAVELIVTALNNAGVGASAAQIDETLWNRGQGTDYKSVPRHRSRTTAY